MISEFMLIVTSILLFGTISAIILYYRRIVALRKEYHIAKGFVNDIIIGVDYQFKKQKERFLFIANKVEDILIENNNITEKVEKYEDRLEDFAQKIDVPTPLIDEKLLNQLRNMQNEVEGIKEIQEKVIKRMENFEKIRKEIPRANVKIDAAIPIKKEKALEPLTETELMVLDIISENNERTAPDIRERIGLTREHTARLMKKLYKDGYLERDTHKMPYMYRLKEEMKKILRKREFSTS